MDKFSSPPSSHIKLTSLRLLQEVADASVSWLPCQTGILDMLETERKDLTLPPAGPFGPPEATESKEASRLSAKLPDGKI